MGDEELSEWGRNWSIRELVIRPGDGSYSSTSFFRILCSALGFNLQLRSSLGEAYLSVHDMLSWQCGCCAVAVCRLMLMFLPFKLQGLTFVVLERRWTGMRSWRNSDLGVVQSYRTEGRKIYLISKAVRRIYFVN